MKIMNNEAKRSMNGNGVLEYRSIGGSQAGLGPILGSGNGVKEYWSDGRPGMGKDDFNHERHELRERIASKTTGTPSGAWNQCREMEYWSIGVLGGTDWKRQRRVGWWFTEKTVHLKSLKSA
jgi:hypothetical protein